MFRDSDWGDDESEFESDDGSLERWDSLDPEQIPLDEVERYGFGEDGHGYRVLVDEDDDDSERFEGFWEEPASKVRSPFAQSSPQEPVPSVMVAEVETENASADIPDGLVGSGAGPLSEGPGTPPEVAESSDGATVVDSGSEDETLPVEVVTLPEGDQVEAEERQGMVAKFRRWVAGVISS